MVRSKCLRCGNEFSYDFIPPQKPRNKKTCYKCRREKRLQAKANKRGLRKDTYLE